MANTAIAALLYILLYLFTHRFTYICLHAPVQHCGLQQPVGLKLAPSSSRAEQGAPCTVPSAFAPTLRSPLKPYSPSCEISMYTKKTTLAEVHSRTCIYSLLECRTICWLDLHVVMKHAELFCKNKFNSPYLIRKNFQSFSAWASCKNCN